VASSRLAFGLGQHHRHGDVVGIGLHDPAEPDLVEIFVLAFGQVQDDARAPAGAFRLGDRERPLAVAFPAPALAVPGLAADDGDPVGDHEGRVEADAELAD